MGSAAEVSTCNIVKYNIPVKQIYLQDKKPKTKERKKMLIQISKEVEYVILTLLEIIVESYEYNPSCSSHR